MRIAILLEQSFDPNAGGVQRSTSKLALIYKSKGHDVIIISIDPQAATQDSWNQIPIVNLDIKKDQLTFRQMVERKKIDLVINQAGYSLSTTKFLKKNLDSKVKIINTLRINPLNFHDNKEEFISLFLNRRKLSFLNNMVFRKIILAYHIIKQRYELNYIIKNTNAFVMLSGRFKKELYYLAPALKKYDHKIHGIANPFERPVIEVSNLGKENIILFVGRLNILQKRVDLLLQIWKQLHSKYPDWQFWVVGDGGEKSMMEDFCRQNQLDRITFFGKDNPTKYYQKARIFHMTSAFEGFGNVLVEAQSFGCIPILFNSYAAAQDIVTEHENGILVSPFNIDEFVSATGKLIENPDQLITLQTNAYRSVERFSYENTYKKWNTIFHNIGL